MIRMITRVLEPRLRQLARKFPVVTVTGPRQSGKTTLCRAVFPDKRGNEARGWAVGSGAVSEECG